jgi:hypothetical protein
MARMNTLLSSLMLFLLLAAPFSIPGRAQLTFGPGPEGAGSTLDIIVAVVNDDVITRRELDAATARIEASVATAQGADHRLAQCWNNRYWNG